jgi:hypothetical protein
VLWLVMADGRETSASSAQPGGEGCSGSGTAGAAEQENSVPTTPEHDEIRLLTGDSRSKLCRFGYTERPAVLSLSIANTASAPPRVLRFIGFARQRFGVPVERILGQLAFNDLTAVSIENLKKVEFVNRTAVHSRFVGTIMGVRFGANEPARAASWKVALGST